MVIQVSAGAVLALGVSCGAASKACSVLGNQKSRSRYRIAVRAPTRRAKAITMKRCCRRTEDHRRTGRTGASTWGVMALGIDILRRCWSQKTPNSMPRFVRKNHMIPSDFHLWNEFGMAIWTGSGTGRNFVRPWGIPLWGKQPGVLAWIQKTKSLRPTRAGSR